MMKKTQRAAESYEQFCGFAGVELLITLSVVKSIYCMKDFRMS